MQKEEKDTAGVESLMTKVYDPPENFKAQAWVNDDSPYKKADEDFEGFWAEAAEQNVTWFKKWDKVLDDSNPPFFKWFTGGKLNISYNCIDRHLATPRKNKAAIIWESETGATRTITYQEMYYEVCRFANVLKNLGLKKGDIATIYLPMVPELAIAMLACCRIGVIHSVVFAGFSSGALQDRIEDSNSKLLITCDGNFRRGKPLAMKINADEAMKNCPTIENCIVVKYNGMDIQMQDGRDHWWGEIIADAKPECEPEHMDAEDILFILYTSGTTGKPKGVVHTTGGYLTGVALTHKWVFDAKEEDTYWCSADIGWVTGHSYILYGPLANGATSVMYDGSPDYPERNRWWSMVEKYRVNIFYTAPTAIRAFMKWGPQWPEKHDMSSLRLLGTVGEPINPEAWLWYYKHIGGERCPIVDTWWQTETGMIMVTPLPGYTPLKPGSATKAFPGVHVDIFKDEETERPQAKTKGRLAITKPWPAMLRTLYNDDQRYIDTYWSRWGGKAYIAGDGAFFDDDGYLWVPGRIDDVMNVAGHRLSTMELESALVAHEAVAEAAVVGKTDEFKGQIPVAFVILKDGFDPSDELEGDLKKFVRTKIGPIATPAAVRFTRDLPKTRSGKIMRRLLRDLEEGKPPGDVTTLRDPTIVDEISEIVKAHPTGSK